LLNDGWRIEQLTFSQVFDERKERETFSRLDGTGVGGAIAIASVPIGSEHRFLLSKGGKWVLCTVSMPQSQPKRMTSLETLCAALN
jgi:hypothetical protein